MRKNFVTLKYAISSVGAILLALSVGSAFCAEGDIEILVSPQTILLGSDQGEMVTVHADIPYSSVNDAAPLTLTLNGVPVNFIKSDARGDLVAKFLEDEVKAIFGDDEPPTAVLTLSGITEDGTPFSGSDVVKIKYRS